MHPLGANMPPSTSSQPQPRKRPWMPSAKKMKSGIRTRPSMLQTAIHRRMDSRPTGPQRRSWSGGGSSRR